jgi:hypothetical protein
MDLGVDDLDGLLAQPARSRRPATWSIPTGTLLGAGTVSSKETYRTQVRDPWAA